MLLLQRYGRDGNNPHNARNRKAALVGSPRMGAAMEAVMTRRLDAFATLGVQLNAGTGLTIPPQHTDIPIKRL